MKPVKKEILTIVVLFIVAVIGVYVVNASTTAPAPVATSLEKLTVPVQTAIEKQDKAKTFMAENAFSCLSCNFLLWLSKNGCNDGNQNKKAQCVTTYKIFYDVCRSQRCTPDSD